MLKKNPIVAFVLVLVLVVVGGFAYQVFGDRYFKKTTDLPKEMNNNRNSSLIGGPTKGNNNSNIENGNVNGLDNLNQNSNTNDNNSVRDRTSIGPKDCENRCADFKEEELDYCREVCGLKVKNANASTTGDCSDLSGLNKDYCLKDIGIEKRDFKFCDQVIDAKIKKNCRDRITEDMLD